MICGGDSFASLRFLQSTIPFLGDNIQGFGLRIPPVPVHDHVCNATKWGTAGIISGAVDGTLEISQEQAAGVPDV